MCAVIAAKVQWSEQGRAAALYLSLVYCAVGICIYTFTVWQVVTEISLVPISCYVQCLAMREVTHRVGRFWLLQSRLKKLLRDQRFEQRPFGKMKTPLPFKEDSFTSPSYLMPF